MRLYRRQARKDFLKVTKKRKPPLQLIRWGIRRQLQYLRRNLRHIETLREKTPLSRLEKKQYRDLLVVSQVFSQQQSMYEKRTHTVADRIVSIGQPYVRPIVRGKSRAEVEFGAKISVVLVDGYTFLEKLSWDAYNEGSDLIGHVEKYHARFGHYPESVHVDKIYRGKSFVLCLAWYSSLGPRARTAAERSRGVPRFNEKGQRGRDCPNPHRREVRKREKTIRTITSEDETTGNERNRHCFYLSGNEHGEDPTGSFCAPFSFQSHNRKESIFSSICRACIMKRSQTYRP